MQREPLIHYQAIVFPLLAVVLHQAFTARQLRLVSRRHGRNGVGHVVRLSVLFLYQRVTLGSVGKIAQTHVAQRTFTNRRMFNRVSILF
ncbi:Uncharacterised protein [Vibrio cholerae]|nr:Uncharacterised protein [Vibrio cholerae]CSA82355.1 Uncharacterised protein [Vibrio cholerae]CSB30861.1 Uncharacterised protein [Vibrio cholerae]CSD12776.1 Uncharacterised protein [Vibrio cholerae]CSD15650.1 Uncharacterised protein [Vibrio cholerae]